MRFPRPSPAAPPLRQIESMRRNFPQFQYRALRQGGLGWSGVLFPTPSSPRYLVHIRHQPGRPPKVFVRSPQLVPGAKHLNPDGSLCLYWPRDFQWRDAELLAETLVPWTAFWLFYYEIWQLTGEWVGPEAPHGEEKVVEEGS